MKAMITFVGDKDPKVDGGAGFNDWPYGPAGQGYKYHFERNVPLEVTNDYIIRKASVHPHFKVEMTDPPPAKKEPEPKKEPEDHDKNEHGGLRRRGI